MNNKGMFYTNVSDYETKEDMMNDFIALRMYDIAKDKEIERLNKENERIRTELNGKESIIKEVREYIERYLNLNLEAFDTRNLLEKELEILDKGSDKEC